MQFDRVPGTAITAVRPRALSFETDATQRERIEKIAAAFDDKNPDRYPDIDKLLAGKE